MLTPWKESYDQPRQHIKKQRYCFVKGPSSQGYGFFNDPVDVDNLISGSCIQVRKQQLELDTEQQTGSK